MTIRPGDIIEAVIDELVMGEIGQQADSVAVVRIEEGCVSLDYGALGKFRLTVTPEGSDDASASG